MLIKSHSLSPLVFGAEPLASYLPKGRGSQTRESGDKGYRTILKGSTIEPFILSASSRIQ